MSLAPCSNCPALSSVRPRHEPCSLKPGWLRGLQSSRLVYKQSRLYSFTVVLVLIICFFTRSSGEARCRRRSLPPRLTVAATALLQCSQVRTWPHGLRLYTLTRLMQLQDGLVARAFGA
eukprot:scaffold12792_cov64-Phaeocystis_antarctica.AAC.4